MTVQLMSYHPLEHKSRQQVQHAAFGQGLYVKYDKRAESMVPQILGIVTVSRLCTGVQFLQANHARLLCYCEVRLGRDGREFRILEFRCMVLGPAWRKHS